jgi:hypothetical protein
MNCVGCQNGWWHTGTDIQKAERITVELNRIPCAEDLKNVESVLCNVCSTVCNGVFSVVAATDKQIA